MTGAVNVRLQRQCRSAGNALETLAAGFAHTCPGFEVFDPAYPDPLSDVPFPKLSRDAETPAGSRAAAELATPQMGFFWSSVQELQLVALDNLYATAALLKRGDGVFSYAQYSTARSALEALATLNWLYDESISGEERRNRVLNELLRSAAWHERLETVILKDIEEAGLVAEYDKNRKRHYVGKPMPSVTRLLDGLGIDYSTMSSITHGEAVGRGLLLSRSKRDGRTTAAVTGNEASLRELIDTLSRALATVTRKVCDYSDWDYAPFEQAETRVRELLRKGYLA